MSRTTITPQRMLTFTLALLVVLATTLVLSAGSARAAFGITSFDGAVTAQDGGTFTQAGGHPYAATAVIEFPSHLNEAGELRTDADVKDTRVDLPPGLVGNPQAVSRCTQRDFGYGSVAPPNCPGTSQIGIARLQLALGGPTPTNTLVPVYNLAPPTGTPAEFGLQVGPVTAKLDARVRTGTDYGVSLDTLRISQAAGLIKATVTIWGVPSDPGHDSERHCPEDGPNTFGCSTSAPRTPLLTLPTSCTGPVPTAMSAVSWLEPSIFQTASFLSHDNDGTPVGASGCGRLRFNPSVDLQPTTRAADAPTGLDVDLSVPQDDTTDGLSTAHVKDVTVALPEGMSVSPSAANGLAACSDAQVDLTSSAPASCPDASKLGTVSVDTPLLADPVEGSVYLGTQESDDPMSGKMFRLFLVASGSGVVVKLEGAVTANPVTGQITATFKNNPQFPFSALHVRFFGGAGGSLATPARCGSYAVTTDISSWSGKVASPASAFAVDCRAGLGGFGPAFSAGTVNPAAGASSPFVLQVSKADGEQDLNAISLSLPQGLLGTLKGNIGRQIGTARAAAGPGPNPFWLPGPVVLEGAYGDAPFSLRVTVPAIAGPFNLGDVVVRQKIYVDPIDAHVTVVSDPLPTIVKGVPVRLQKLQVAIDKAGFMRNPTSCTPKAITGTLGAAQGATAAVSSPFAAAGCESLDLKPQLALTLSGKGQTTDGKHPAVSADVTQLAGQANLKKVRVALPLSLALDPDNANGLCEFVDGSKVEPTCPKASIVGTATAVSPLLDEPLSGPVYFVKNIRKDPKSGREIRTLPKLVIPLVGQNGVKLTLTGTSDVVDDQLVSTFDNIPDAPVSSFKLNINGGKGGILVVSDADICKSTQIADQQIDGQNGKQADTGIYMQTPACTLRILSKKVGKTSVAVKVGGLGAGKVSVSGRGIKKTTKTVAKSTVATITAKRTKGKPGKVTVSFDPAGPAKARKTAK